MSIVVEDAPGLVAIFGEVPDALELLNLDLFPEFDRNKLTDAFGIIGTWSTVGGNLAVAADSLQGL